MTASRPEGAKGELEQRVFERSLSCTHGRWVGQGNFGMCLACIATLCAEYAREQVEKVFHETGPPTISEQWLRDAHSRGVDVVEAVTEYANVRAQLQTLRGELEEWKTDYRKLSDASVITGNKCNELRAENTALEARERVLREALILLGVGPYSHNHDIRCTKEGHGQYGYVPHPETGCPGCVVDAALAPRRG